MNELIASFVQHIPSDGYQLAQLGAFKLHQLPDINEGEEALYWPRHAVHSHTYQPLVSEPALFYKFADLGRQPKVEQILSFANQYGWLGASDAAFAPAHLLHDLTAVSRDVLSAEFIHTWWEQLNHFIPMLELWHAIASNDDDYLSTVIAWQPDYSSVAYHYQHISTVLIASVTVNTELFATFSRDELLTPAKVLLARSINQHLSEHCHPALLFNDDAYQGSHLYFRCYNLLGVIWLQLANAMATNTLGRRCAECDTPFIPSFTERGKKKRFCTDACKSRNYRRHPNKRNSA